MKAIPVIRRRASVTTLTLTSAWLVWSAFSLPATAAMLAQAEEVKLPVGEKVWWYKEQLGVRIPCAITGDAVTYFSEVVTKNAKQEFKSYAMPSSRLVYLAGVRLHKEFKLDEKTFKDVSVVTMKLSFSANFTAESTSGMSFEKTRIVILDSDNKVLHISGDGPTEVPVLML